MGDSSDSCAAPDECPLHNVCISAFAMDVHEVTNAEYKRCVDAGACSPPSSSSSNTRGSYYGGPAYGDYPVIYMDWNSAAAYCGWADKRLPSEAQWEYAARGGLAGKRYPWGDTLTGADANYINSADPEDDDTNAQGSYPPNGFGLYDMAGNVLEWVNDRYGSGYYGISPPNDPPGPGTGGSRVVRGGSFLSDASTCRVADRFPFAPADKYNSLGFRCAN